MDRPIARTYTSRPSAREYMLGGLLPRRRVHGAPRFPPLRLAWQGFRTSDDDVAALRAAAGPGGLPAGPLLSLMAPQVLGFRLPLALLTRREWPLRITGALQVRGRVRLHATPPADAPAMLYSATGGSRVLDKGVEADVHSTLVQGDATHWESIVTFYYRGRFGAADPAAAEEGAPRQSPALPESPDDAPEIARWRTDRNDAARFCRWTGDYNPLHRSDWYAHRFGFGRAFHHPPAVLLQCLARLPAPAGPCVLDYWVKGQVFYGSEVSLSVQGAAGDATRFWLRADGDARPALVGELRSCKPDGSSNYAPRDEPR